MSADLTALLRAATEGDEEAFAEVAPIVYQDLRVLARSHMRSQRGDHTLQTTGLVHEAFLKVVDQRRIPYTSRKHFFAVASVAMRHILVNWARDKKREKRGGDAVVIGLGESPEPGVDVDPGTVLSVHEALGKLAALSERAARVVECRYFAGLSVDETCEALDVSPSTVKREWRTARAWLERELRA